MNDEINVMKNEIDKYGLKEIRQERTNYLYESTIYLINQFRQNAKRILECKWKVAQREANPILDNIWSCIESILNEFQLCSASLISLLALRW